MVVTQGQRPGTYQLRVCGWDVKCDHCKKEIAPGENYYDGGYSRRFHMKCAFENTKVREDKCTLPRQLDIPFGDVDGNR